MIKNMVPQSFRLWALADQKSYVVIGWTELADQLAPVVVEQNKIGTPQVLTGPVFFSEPL